MGDHLPFNAAEVLIPLDRAPGVPVRRRLAIGLRDLIRSGQLGPGTVLPSTRVLARDLQLSRGVIVDAYAQLVAEGYLDSRGGSCTRVAPGAVAGAPQERRQYPEQRAAAPLTDLRPGAPDTAAFPRALWLTSLRAVLTALPARELGYVEPWGCWALRSQLAGYLARVRGVMARPEQVVIVNGVTQGLTLLLRVLAAAGHTSVAVEDPSNAVQRQVVGRYLPRLVDVPVDADGLQVDALARTPTRAVVVTPAHQYPTGVVMSPARRAAVLRWARDRDAVVIEDDYDSEFRYDGDPIGCLQGRDPSRVALLGSVSKTLAPGLRLGWVIPPPQLLSELQSAKRDDDFGSPVLEQHTFARLLDGGGYDRHLRQVRRQYRRRRDALVTALAEHLPRWSVMGTAAGLHLVVTLPGELSEGAVVQAAGAHGVLVLGLSSMRGAVSGDPALALSYARHPPEQLAEAVAALAAAVADLDPAAAAAEGLPRGSPTGTSALDYY